jgi:signal peptidase I
MEMHGTEIEAAGVAANANVHAAPVAKPDYAGMGGRLVKQLGQCLLVAAAAYGCFQFSSHYLVQAVQVEGHSMAPTLLNSDRYVLNRWIYRICEPGLQEVVVLQDPGDAAYLVKRIVAKEGDRIYLKGGRVFLNGKLLKESYLPRGTTTYGDPRYREQLWICGVNQYFVLGDNRNNSADSRIYGAVPRKYILGRIML